MTAATVVYHPDPDINAEVAAEVLEAERFDLSIGYPPSRWVCPECGTAHSRGHIGAIGVHRCLSCGYVGAAGATRMSGYLLGALKCIGWGFLILAALNLAGVLWLLAINPDPPDEPDDVTATYLAYLEGGWDQ